MKGGEGLIEEAELGIYGSGEPTSVKADLLTGMAIFGGMISPEIPVKLLQRRRDIMIESAAYDIIKQEGMEEGIKIGIERGREEGIQEGIEKGLQQGIQQGLEKGLRQGLVQEAQEMVIEALQERFGIVEAHLLSQVRSITNRDILKALHRKAIKAANTDEFKEALQVALQ